MRVRLQGRFGDMQVVTQDKDEDFRPTITIPGLNLCMVKMKNIF
jgi:hypothetical protein